MADRDYRDEKEHEAEMTESPDPIVKAAIPSTGEDVISEKEVVVGAMEQGSDCDDDEIVREQEQQRRELGRTRSAATEASAASAATSVPDAKPKLWAKKLNPLLWGAVPPVPAERIECPEASANFFSRMIFHWQGSMMQVGYRRPLEKNDIWLVNHNRAVKPMSERVRKSFHRRVANGDKHPLLWALNEAFFVEFWVGGLCQLSSTIFQVLSPFVLRFLIKFATKAYNASAHGAPAPHIGHGIGLVFGITIMQICQSLGTNHFIFRGMMIGGQVRATLINLIYEKSMVISARAKSGGRALAAENSDSTGAATGEEGKTAAASDEEKGRPPGKPKSGSAPPTTAENPLAMSADGVGWGNGRVVNLMGVDTYRVDQACGLFHIIWAAPLSCIITLVLLLINLTYAALAGFGLLMIGIPLLTRAMRSLFIRRKQINRVTDQRVSLTQEILSSVRFVKYFGWESSFLARLEEYRATEIGMIQVLLSIRNAIMAVSLALPIFASMLSFITYSLSHHNLNPAGVFSSLALFNGLRMPLNLLPLVVGQVTDAWNSLKRIQEYLLAEERDEDVQWKADSPNTVEVHDASFTWERTPTQETSEVATGPEGAKKKAASKKAFKKQKDELKQSATETTQPVSDGIAGDTASTLVEEREPFKLNDLSFTIGRHELVAVIGSVGSGKTSLLAALAGDMRKTKGEIVLGGSRAFCPQYAWIQNTTLRNNIIFGRDMDEKRYREVIKACALQQDLDMLPSGDSTEIGERGITISGGQKQRLNIARAIYFDADIILMDDPLSAVDAHVGRHIFDNAILGLLKDKCRILATHQLWVLNRCDRIIWMEGGKIQAVDTFPNLMRHHAAFQQLMESTAVEDEDASAAAPRTNEASPEAKKKTKSKGLMQQEERAVSSVPWSAYVDYLRESGTILNGPLIFFLLVVAQGANITTSLWLSYWTSDRFNLSTGAYIGIYAALGAAQASLVFAFMVSISICGTAASKAMLRRAITRVLRAPMSFFDTTPLGRITNRFSRDVDVMDNSLTDAIRIYFFSVGSIIAVFALIIAYFHYFAIALGPLFIIFLFATSYYRSSARELKRYEAVLRSHVFAKFGEGLSGVSSIRAYGLCERFVADLHEAIDDMNSAYYLTFSNQRWLSLRLDAIGNLLVFTTGILVVTSRFDVSPSIAGLVLSYILSIVQMIQFTVRQLAEVENGMNAVERLQYYGQKLEEEAPAHTVEVRKSWPERGEIVFDDVKMRYRAGLPLVLQGLSMHVQGGERIGIVGRTGAGKSSIMSTLFRLVEISSGHITIDGIDISTIGLSDLRSRLAIIPQDPTLFRGTVRSNLDPFNEHTDLELWEALRQADLVSDEAVEQATADHNVSGSGGDPRDSGRIHLDSVVEEDGLNFSLGQRQLMALGRALVRGSQIIVCDEATSSVDMETDDKIQQTIATGFRGKTLLCIAHRLRTIVGYDRICVMDQGRIAELDSPLALWQKEGGIFRSMCERSGIREEDIRQAQNKLESYVASQAGKQREVSE